MRPTEWELEQKFLETVTRGLGSFCSRLALFFFLFLFFFLVKGSKGGGECRMGGFIARLEAHCLPPLPFFTFFLLFFFFSKT